MNTIFKYEFPITDRFSLDLPTDARILTAFIQNGKPCLCAEVDTNRQLSSRRFAVIGTGLPRPDGCSWVVTFPDPPFIWHLYKEAE